MSDKGKLLKILARLLPGDINAEISVRRECRRQVRVRNNSIDQGIENQTAYIQVRVEENGRVGLSSGNRLTIPALRAVVATARANTGGGSPGPLILTGSTGYREMNLLDSRTVNQSCEDLSADLEEIIRVACAANLNITGSLTAEAGEFAIVNTAGLTAGTRVSAARFEADVSSVDGAGSGFGYDCHRSIAQMDSMGAFLQAAAKTQASQFPQPLGSGEYTVILEPAAVADLMAVLAKTVFNGRALLQGQSPLSRAGQKLFGDNINIWDDGLDSRGMAVPMDFQGVPKQRLHLVTRGVVNNLALDNETAARLNLPGTGHAVQTGNRCGPAPGHIFLEPGNAMLDDMIASTKNGILITRMTNLNVLDPCSGMVTGTTGSGTLLIRDGKLVSGLPNLRFIQNLVLALNRVEMIGDETKLFGGLWGGIRVPALKIHSFSIRGSNIGQV